MLVRVLECIGVAAAMHAPLPADAPEWSVHLADSGDAMLPAQHVIFSVLAARLLPGGVIALFTKALLT